MLDLPIEQRYQKGNRMFHSSGFAIAAGVIGVGSAVAGGVMSSQAAGKAAGAQASAGKKLQRQTRRATQSYEERMGMATDQFVQKQQQLQEAVAAINPNINLPQYSLAEATEAGIEAANRDTDNTIRQVGAIIGQDPGKAIQNALQTLSRWENRLGDQYVQVQQGIPLVDQQQAVVSRLIEGDLPDVTLRAMSRRMAEFAGAGFSQPTAGRTPFIQRPQAMLAENIRQSSEARMMQGLALAPQITQQRASIAGTTGMLAGQAGGLSAIQNDWMRTAKGFLASVPTYMTLGAQGREQDIGIQRQNFLNQMNQFGMMGDIGSQMFGAQTGLAQSLYGAQTGQAQLGYQTQQAANEAMLARDMANVQAIQGVGEATAGAFGGLSNVRMAQMRAGQGGGGGFPGGFNYEQVYGRAIPAGGRTTPGFGNFDYGV
jgi:hypothetical protein